MMKVKAWRVYYEDGSSFSNEDGTWAQAPPFGLQCVVYYDVPPYRTLDSGGNEGVFVFQGEGSLSQYKMGVWTDGNTCWRIHEMAREDDPPKFLPEVD